MHARRSLVVVVTALVTVAALVPRAAAAPAPGASDPATTGGAAAPAASAAPAAPEPAAADPAAMTKRASASRVMDPSEFQAMTPTRLLDTRDGTGGHLGKVGPAETIDLQVTGRGGIPASDVGAVVVNITSTEASAVSFITAWPAGEPWPLASNVNTEPGVNTPDLAVVKLGTGGRISLYNNSGTGHLVADALGWFPTTATFTSLTPARLLDTRDGTGGHLGKVGPAESIDLQVTGRGGVPAADVGSVVVNITSTEASAESFLTAWPAGDPWPLASNVNTDPGVNTPNLAFVKLGTGGRISLYNNSGTGHVVVDVLGWFPTQSNFRPHVPFRLMDTRDPGTGVPPGKVGPKQTVTLDLPDEPIGAVVVNITSTEASADSFVTAWPTGEPWPLASNVNTEPGVNTPNLAIVKMGAGGDISFYNNSGTGQLVVDLLGWFPIGSTYAEVSQPGFSAEVEIPSTTKQADDVHSVTPSIVPSGPAVTLSLSSPQDPYSVGRLVDLDPATVPPDGFHGQVTAATPPDADGMQQVTAVPGTLQVVTVLGAGAPRYAVDDHLVLDPTPDLPDGFLGRVVLVEDLPGGGQRVTAVPGLLQDAFLQLDIDVDVGRAVAGGTVTPEVGGVPLSPMTAGGSPAVSGDISAGFSLENLVRLAQITGNAKTCNLTGLTVNLQIGLGYALHLDWAWYYKWGWLPIPTPLVTATVTPEAEAAIKLDKASVACSITLASIGYKFKIPKTKIGAKLWVGPVLDLEAGVTGIGLDLSATASVKMGVERNQFVFDPKWKTAAAVPPITAGLDPRQLSAFAQADLWFTAGVEVIGIDAFRAAYGPFVEFTFSPQSTRPWWAIDLGLAAKIEVFGKSVFNAEAPYIFGLFASACSTSAPYTTPCVTPKPTARANGDDDRSLQPRLRVASATTALDPLRITTTSLPAGDTVVAYPTTKLATAGLFAADSWSVVAGSLPPGITLDPATGVLAGTATAAGLFPFTVQAKDAAGGPSPPATKQLTMRIWPNAHITTGDIAAWQDIAFSQQLQAEGWGGGPFTWAWVGGQLPPGLDWDPATGTISGTPTAAMTSFATFVVTDAKGRSDTRTLGVTVKKLTTDRLVVGDTGPATVDVDADGNVVVFETQQGLEPGDTNGLTDVYVFDRTTNRLTRLTDGLQDSLAADPSISDDGRYVAYRGEYWQAPGELLYRAILVHDRTTGATTAVNAGVTCAAPTEPGVPAAHAALCAAFLPDLAGGYGDPQQPVISGDGSHVAYVATRYGVGPQVLVWDRATGTTRIASIVHDGSPAPNGSCNDFGAYLSSSSDQPSLSGDGRVVAFTIECSGPHALRVDLSAGTMVDVLPGHDSAQPSVSGDGARVAFVEPGGGTRSGAGALHRFDAGTGTAALVPVAATVTAPAISGDGSVIAFSIVVSLPNGTWRNVFAFAAGPDPERITVEYAANGPDGDSAAPALSADGTTVVFSSSASNLTPGDTNGWWDVFVHRR